MSTQGTICDWKNTKNEEDLYDIWKESLGYDFREKAYQKVHTECFSWFKTGIKVRLCIHIYLFLQKQTKPPEGKTRQWSKWF